MFGTHTDTREVAMLPLPPRRLAATVYRPAAPPGRRREPPVEVRIRVCPECAGTLAQAGGCRHCPHCGWGRCG